MMRYWSLTEPEPVVFPQSTRYVPQHLLGNYYPPTVEGIERAVNATIREVFAGAVVGDFSVITTAIRAIEDTVERVAPAGVSATIIPDMTPANDGTLNFQIQLTYPQGVEPDNIPVTPITPPNHYTPHYDEAEWDDWDDDDEYPYSYDPDDDYPVEDEPYVELEERPAHYGRSGLPF